MKDNLVNESGDLVKDLVNDTISRTAAIETVRKAQSIGQAHRMLVQLPSAQPSVSKMEIVEDCISRAAVLNLIEQSCCDLEYDCDNVALRKEVEALPSAQPSVSKEEMVGDTISRQAAIKAICEDGTMLERQGKYTMTMAERKQKDADILDSLPSSQPGWIPCSRELPKPNEEDGNGFHKAYLVQDGQWMDVARWNGKYWVAWGYSTVLLNVIAWMPLPAPYIPEGDDKHEG